MCKNYAGCTANVVFSEVLEMYIEVQKDFALAVIASKIPLTGVLFNLRKGSIQSVSEGLTKTEPKHVVEVLKLEVEDNKDVV